MVNNVHQVPVKNLIIAAILSFLGMALEPVVIIIERVFFAMDRSRAHFNNDAIHLTIMCILWGIWAYFITLYSKESLHVDLFKVGGRPIKKHFMLSLYLFVIAITVTSAFNGWNVKSISGLFFCMDTYENRWPAIYILLNIQYLIETVLISFTLFFAQFAGEKITGQRTIPWGGLFLALTWGSLKILLLGPGRGFALVLSALLYGYTLLLMQHNLKYAIPMVILIYLL